MTDCTIEGKMGITVCYWLVGWDFRVSSGS
jgi:hypothetical protein